MKFSKPEIKIRRHLCPICKMPFRSQAGRAVHYRFCHTWESTAQRNWAICYNVLNGRMTLSEAADEYKCHPGTIQRIVNRYVQWPRVYDLDPELEFDPFLVRKNLDILIGGEGYDATAN